MIITPITSLVWFLFTLIFTKTAGTSVAQGALKVTWYLFCSYHTKTPKHLLQNMQVNLVTAWIDGSSIYGTSTSWSDSLRSFSGGLLASGSELNMPKQGGGRNLMWSAADPSTGDHGPHGLYSETHVKLYFHWSHFIRYLNRLKYS